MPNRNGRTANSASTWHLFRLAVGRLRHVVLGGNGFGARDHSAYPNKTARRNPKPVIVPIHPVLKDMLSTMPTDKRGDYVLPETAALYRHRSDMVTDMVQRHFKTCGITLHKPGTGMDGKRAVIEVGFHSLRHTFVSLCRESNAPLAVVESIVGHSNPAMTRHYTHVGEAAAGSAVAALPAVIGKASAEQPKRQEAETLREIETIVKAICAENWIEKRAALLQLLPKVLV